MDDPLLDNFDERMWRQHTKASLKMEINRGYKEVKDFPTVELNGSLAAQGLKRLCDMYQDPQFGPDFFFKTIKMIRSYLRQYRLCKNNPTEFGRFFHCSTPSPGLVLHFNSVTAKKEIYVILPFSDQPPHGPHRPQKPAKVQIAHIIRWHNKRKIKAYNTQVRRMEAMISLQDVLLEAERGLNAALNDAQPLFDQLARFLEEFRQLRGKMETRKIAAKKLHYDEVLEMLLDFARDLENGVKLSEDFEALNPRMFGTKEFMQMRIDHCKILTKYKLDQGKQSWKNIVKDLGD